MKGENLSKERISGPCEILWIIQTVNKTNNISPNLTSVSTKKSEISNFTIFSRFSNKLYDNIKFQSSDLVSGTYKYKKYYPVSTKTVSKWQLRYQALLLLMIVGRL